MIMMIEGCTSMTIWYIPFQNVMGHNSLVLGSCTYFSYLADSNLLDSSLYEVEFFSQKTVSE